MAPLNKAASAGESLVCAIGSDRLSPGLQMNSLGEEATLLWLAMGRA